MKSTGCFMIGLLMPKTGSSAIYVLSVSLLRVSFTGFFVPFYREVFFSLISDTVRDNFKTRMPKLLEHLSSDGENIARNDLKNLIFGDFMDPHADVRIYDEVRILNLALFLF